MFQRVSRAYLSYRFSSWERGKTFSVVHSFILSTINYLFPNGRSDHISYSYYNPYYEPILFNLKASLKLAHC